MEANKYITLRKYLHTNPELSGKEVNTTCYLFDYFKENSFGDEIYKLGETGLLVKFNGDLTIPSVMVRCELDALPITEDNGFNYKSNVDGVSHKCGHDGHMAIVTQLADLLSENSPKGVVYLLFQPAEENGEGANWVVNNSIFKEHCQPEYVFALHNLPGSHEHSITIKPFECTPSVISIDVELKGKTAHAAEPQNGYNPAYLIGELQEYCLRHSITNPENDDFQIITPIYIEAGTRDFGIAAGEGRVGFTFRTKDNDKMKSLKDSFISFLTKIGRKYTISFTYNWSHEFSSIFNDEKCVDIIKMVAIENDLALNLTSSPFPWGEDFGVFTTKFKGAMFGLGAGDKCPALHNPNYDFPDELIGTGSNIFNLIIRKLQS